MAEVHADQMKDKMKQQRVQGVVYVCLGFFMFYTAWRRGQLPPHAQGAVDYVLGMLPEALTGPKSEL